MTHKTRLLFLDQYPVAGGGQRVLADICADAASRSVSSVVAAPAGLQGYLPSTVDFVPMTLSGAKEGELGVPTLIRILIASMNAAQLLRLKDQAEPSAAIVANGPRVLVAAALTAHMRGIPLFWVVHRYHSGWQSMALRWTAWVTGARVIAVSRSGLHSLGLRSGDKHTVIPNGTGPIDRAIAAGLHHPLRIASVGRLTLLKGHHVFAAACKALTGDREGYTVEVIGDPVLSSARDLEEITQACANAGVPLRRLEGAPIPYDEVDVVVLASLPGQGEGCPLVLLEAMANGKVVVATDVAGIREVVQDRITGFIVPHGEVAALTDALQYLIRHRDIAAMTASAGQAHVGRWHNVRAQTQALVSRVLQGNGAAAADEGARWQCGIARQPRIALIIDNWTPNKESGVGGSQYFHGLRQHLEATGAAITVFARSPGDDICFVPPAYVEGDYWSNVSLSWRLRRLIDRFSEFDLIHSQSAVSLPFLRYCRAKGIPTIFDCRTSLIHTTRVLVRFQVAMLTLIPPDHVIFCDQPSHAWFSRVHRGRGSYIPVPTDLPVARSMPSIRGGGGRRLLFTGRLAAENGFDSLLRATPLLLDRFPELTIHVAGVGPLSEAAAVMASDSQGRFVCHGLVPFHEMDRIYGQADALVLPSRGDGVSLVALEAMARGVPVASTAVGGMRTLVDLEVVERMRSVRPMDIADATARVLDPARGSVLANRGAAYVASKHLWTTNLPKYFDVYRKLGIVIDGSGRRGPD